MPVPNSFEDFWKNLKEISNLENLPYKTIIIDSVSKLDSFVVDRILSQESGNKEKSSLANACGGYGKGYDKAKLIHEAVKFALDKLRDKGITIIYIAHASVAKYKAPDEEDYDKYSIIINHDKSRAVYINDVDAVLFCKLKYFVVENDSKRSIVKSTNQRVIATSINAGHVAKNRYDMPEEIKFSKDGSFEEISKYIPFYQAEYRNAKDNKLAAVK